MAGCVLQSGISVLETSAAAGLGEQMPCHVPSKKIRLILQHGLSKN